MILTKRPYVLWQPRKRYFVLRRLHAMSGVVPLGLFLMVHLVMMATALFGREPFDVVMNALASPWMTMFEAIFVMIPLMFHALYGMFLAIRSGYNIRSYPFSGNWMYTAQRASGIFAFAFVGVHLFETWVRRISGDLATDQLYIALMIDLSSTVGGFPYRAVLYMLGVGACVFHFANGVTVLAVSSGTVKARRALLLLVLVGVALTLLGSATVAHFATGAPLFGDR